MNDFLLNDVVVRPRRNELCIDGRSEKLPAKFIDVLMVLAERQGEVFGKAVSGQAVMHSMHWVQFSAM